MSIIRVDYGTISGGVGSSFDLNGAKYANSFTMTCCGSTDSTLVDSQKAESDSITVTLKRAFKGKMTFVGSLRGSVSREATVVVGSTTYTVETIGSTPTPITEYDIDVPSGTTITFTIGQCDYAYGATANFIEG